MPWAPIAAAGIGGISSILGGFLSGKPKTTTTTMTPTWSPEMTGLSNDLANYGKGLMNDPSAGMGPIKSAAEEGINRRYASLPDQVSRQMASRGYGSSGNMGNTMFQTAYARSGEMSDLDSRMAQMIMQQRNNGASLSEQLLNMTRGTTTTSTGPNTSMSDGLMSAGNGLGNIATLMTLSKLLKGGGSSSVPIGGGDDSEWD